MKKILTLLFLCTAFLSKAQEDKPYMLKLGASAAMGIGNTENFEFNGGGYGIGIHYKYIISGQENQTITIGTHSIVGFEASSSTTGDTYMGAIFDMPIVFDFNAGNQASRSSTNRFGIYAGGGLDFHYSNINGSSFFAVGPIFNTGFHARFLGHTNTYHLSVMKALNHRGVYVFGIGLVRQFKRNQFEGKSNDMKSGGWEYIY